jgi:ELWxxDGT repeat protein
VSDQRIDAQYEAAAERRQRGELGNGDGEPDGGGSTLAFTASDGVHGARLWSSHGTATVADINGTSSSEALHLTNVNGLLYFTEYTMATGFQLWQSNGTGAGTVKDTGLTTDATNVLSTWEPWARRSISPPRRHDVETVTTFPFCGGGAIDADRLDSPGDALARQGPGLNEQPS